MLGVLAAVVVIVLVVLITRSGGQTTTPPATGAASVVPGDALAYIHISTDDSRSQVRSALALAGRFPGYSRLRSELIARLGSTGPPVAGDFQSNVRPWLGKDAALALLSTGASSTSSLIVVGVSNRVAAARFLAGLPTDGSASYEGTKITGHPRAGDTAFVGNYLVIGHSSAIRAAVDAAAGRGPSLAQNAAYQRASASEPAGRALDAYITGTGVTQLLASRHGTLGAIGALLYQPALEGLAVSLTPVSGGLRVLAHSVLDPQVARSGALPFRPSLASSAPAGAGFFLDATGLDTLLPRMLRTTGIGGRDRKSVV